MCVRLDAVDMDLLPVTVPYCVHLFRSLPVPMLCPSVSVLVCFLYCHCESTFVPPSPYLCSYFGYYMSSTLAHNPTVGVEKRPWKQAEAAVPFDLAE